MRQKKRRIIFTGIFLLTAMLMMGCGKKAANDVERIEKSEAGLVFRLSKEYQEKGMAVEGAFEDYNGNTSVGVFWYYKPVTDKLTEQIMSLKPEELTMQLQLDYFTQMAVHTKCLMNVTLIEEQKYKDAIGSGMSPDQMSVWSPAEEFGTNDGYVYLLSLPENDTDGMEEEEKALFEECAAYIQTVKENLSFMEISAAAGLPEKMPAFTSKDLDGNTVTESIFAEKDLTVVNIWGTFCTPCVEEMPELGEWAKEMPDNVQIVGIISDISGDDDTKRHDLAVTITEKAGADFTQIIASSDLDSIMQWVTGVPTTLFVDRNGNIVGKPIVGADVEGYKKFVEDYVNGQ